MNKKGNIDGLGVIIGTFLAVIVGLTIFSGSIIPTIGETTTLANINNHSFTTPAVNATVNLPGKTASEVYIINGTGSESAAIGAGNYTITDNVVVNGELTATYQTLDNGMVGQIVNLSYVAQPTNYIADSGARSLTGLIAVFSALAILVAAIVAVTGSRVLEMFGR